MLSLSKIASPLKIEHKIHPYIVTPENRIKVQNVMPKKVVHRKSYRLNEIIPIILFPENK